jgi:hypothetical protein
MADLKFYKVSALPGTLEPDAFYFVPSTGPGGGLFAESYLTDASANPRLIGNTAMIQELVATANGIELQLVADIAARDALTLSMNSIVLVQDASADATVNSGAAMYFWDNAGTTFIKVTEFESLDVVVDWADITNKPVSTIAAIDQAVADSHTHANKPILDALTDSGSGLVITSAERTQIGTNQTDIAALQADNHTHANKTELDKITEDGNGCMLYNGELPMAWTTKDW